MIEVEGVTKRYGRVTAVDGVSFRIDADEVVGFLGPNGAGKSTLLKVMCTWLAPDEGAVSIAGFDTRRRPLEVRRRVGYLPEHNALYEGMRVDRFLRFVARMRGLKGATLRERLEWVVERCGIGPVIGKWIHECSKGFKQRIGLAAALVHDPPVLLLDEPTHGLDPLQVVELRDFLRSLRNERAILFSSHVLAEVAAISDRLLVIHHGRLLLDAPVSEMEERARERDASLEDAVLDVVRRSEPGEVSA